MVENKIPGLCFPEVPESWVVFGMGNGVQALVEARWLNDVELYYWGDVDTEGFRILARFREAFPHCRSMFMNEATLLRYQESWGQEPPATRRMESVLVGLTGEEVRVFEGLLAGRWGERVRLEQEAIRHGEVISRLAAIVEETVEDAAGKVEGPRQG